MRLMIAVALVVLWASGGTSGGGNGTLTTYEDAEMRDLQAMSPHSRRRRYIVFPKGSSLQLILELLVQVPSQVQVVLGPTLQVAWPLPSDPLKCFRSRRSHPPQVKTYLTSAGVEALAGNKRKIFSDVVTLLDMFGMTVGLAWQLPDDPMIYSEFKKKHKIYKRNALKKMETFLDKPWGANGRQCVLKALCESGQRTPSKKDFLTEILHKIFSVEAEELDVEDSDEDRVYRRAHQSLNQNCQTLYPECSFSLFHSAQ